MKKVAVIGAGASGLCSAKRCLEAGLSVTVFEKSDVVGGTWVYTDNVGKDEHGYEVHTSMYQGLRTNLPKEVMGFPDFPVPEQEQSYIPAENFLAFLQQYSEHFKLGEVIEFRQEVIMVKPRSVRDRQWEVRLPRNS
jgi:dimethylaniline monooxygenase (N-oxide forming)